MALHDRDPDRRRGVDHDAATAPLEGRDPVLHPEEHALEVHAVHGVPGLLALVRERGHRAAEPGVVEQHVDPAEGRLGGLDHALDVGGDRDVDLDRHRAVADDSRGLLLATAAVGTDDPGALGGEEHRARAPDAGAGTGDDGDLPVEAAHVVRSSADRDQAAGTSARPANPTRSSVVRICTFACSGSTPCGGRDCG
jgi:hypothetical protein